MSERNSNIKEMCVTMETVVMASMLSLWRQFVLLYGQQGYHGHEQVFQPRKIEKKLSVLLLGAPYLVSFHICQWL